MISYILALGIFTIVIASECPYSNPKTDCLNATTTLASLCGIPDNVFAWYTGDSYNAFTNEWFDQGGYCRNIFDIVGTITSYSDFNEQTYITGTTSTRVYFPYDVLPINYTFFHVSRYFDGAEDIIFQAMDYAWLSGFHVPMAGVAHHENWITSSTNDIFGRQFFISTDLRNQYRTNGVDRTKSIQTDWTDITHQYRLSINNGYYGTGRSSAWAVAEIIVFDRELLVDEYTCVEQYLGGKYNIDIYKSASEPKSTEIDNLEEKCELLPTYAVYNGDSFDEESNVWSDMSGNGRNIDDYMITGDIAVHQLANGLNNQTYISGTTTTTIDFPVEVLPTKYTFFHVARYDGTEGRIFQSYTNWFSGFHSGKSGCAYRSGHWITSSTLDRHGTDWVISTDQADIYRSQGVSRQTTIRPADHSNDRYRMTINNGAASTEDSDFAIAEIIVFDYQLSPNEYKCVEDYLSEKYNITMQAIGTKCINDTITDEAMSTYLECNLSDYKLVAWYDGSTFDVNDNVWYDKSGQCYNVDNNYISGTITTYDNLNNHRYITGTTSTTIEFPSAVLPLQYTFFHVARYFDGTENRIFQSYDYPFLSGFHGGKSGVAHHSNWITSSSIDYHGNSWVMSSDQRSLYRSQGISRMVDDQAAASQSLKYRLAINSGLYPAEDSAFAIAEMIVIDGELNPKEIRCVEEQLSDKYGILNSATNCKPKNDSLTIKCGLKRDVFAWYQGDNYDNIETMWPDDSGYCRNIDTPFITGTVTTQNNLNNHQYLTGTTSTRIYFPYDVLPLHYTLFHVARYYDGVEDMIFQAYDYGFLSGFHHGESGVALHENWITSSTIDSHGTTWVLSQDQRSVYRSNGIARMTDSQSSSYSQNKYRLSVNNGHYGTSRSSDWAIAEVIVFDYEMDPSEYQCIEQYLGDKYDITMVNEIPCQDLSVSNIDILSECGVEDDIFTWYDGSTFDFSAGVWYDKSGHCRNVENEFISGTINIANNLNSNKYLTGTISSSIAFPQEVLPTDYTFFHVAKYNDGTRNRIFQSFDYNWLSGFHESAESGVAYHENWITPVVDRHGTDWVISTDARSLYRSNGVYRMNDNQTPGFKNNRYKLGLNTGLLTGTTYTSDWAVAEMIVFDKTLDPTKYKCMENYLSVKYDICLTTYSPTASPTPPTKSPTLNPTDTQCLSPEDLALRDYECQLPDLSEDLYVTCELLADDIYAHYDGDSYNKVLNEWFDKSGNCRNVKDQYISGTITTYDDLNGHRYLTGTTTTTIDFPNDVLPEEYTFFHMARYFEGAEGRIFQANDYDWLSGFWSGFAGVAHHQNWITPYTIDLHGREWVVSTDQRSKYRSDGKTRTNNAQSTTYANNRYRLSINNGYYSGQDSDWAVGEIIVMDKEVNTKKIKCIENYLSNKYDETIYNSECNDNDIEVASLANQCEFNSDLLFAWYNGNSYDKPSNIWYDKSGNCRNVDNDYIDGELDKQNDLNTKYYVNGSTSTIIQFPFEILPTDYTFMHVAKYQEGGTQSRIFQSNDYNWFSGFQQGGYAGIAYHENWITASNEDYHGTGWVISTDQRSLYRSNGVSRLTTRQLPSYANNRYELVINKGYSSTYKSDFAIAEMLVFEAELSANTYKCIENYLSDKYDVIIVEPSECLENTDINSFQTQCSNVLGNDLQPFSWYDGGSYSFGDKVWQDKSGNCRNVESEHISGNIFINSDLNSNGEKYLIGTTASRMEFPYEILPMTYTFIHVAKFISTATGRIFNGLDHNFWSGFNEYHVMDVSCLHNNWLTSVPGNTAANYLKDWIISTDQRNIYRANGQFKMINDQDVGYRSLRYRIGLNTGYHPTTNERYGDWAVAEVLVFDRELEPIEYKCIEEYLSDKYNISVDPTPCQPQTDPITQQCGLQQSPYGWYSGKSFDSAQNMWFDNSKYCRNIDNELITNTLTHVTNDPYDEMNGESYITGGTSTRINFPYELLPIDYNFFHVARYYDGTEDIIFQAYDYGWLSGFYAGSAGVSSHEYWITPNVDTYGRQWIVSNDQRSLYRTNGIGRTTDTQPVGYKSHQYRLAVNQGHYGTDDPSNFAIAEIIIFNYELSSNEYKCVENYLCSKYDKACDTKSIVLDFEQVDIDNNNEILLTDTCTSIDINNENIVGWYNGDSYNSIENIWYDQSGYGRNIDNNYISGTVDIQSNFNNYKYINGSTSTTIDFPYDLLPIQYTLFHVAKYNGNTKDRIFQSHDFSFTSGFTDGKSGTAYHQNWITPSNVDYHGSEWVLSTDQRNVYRSNGVDRMTNDQTESYNNNRYILTINNGYNGAEDSDFAIAEIIIFNDELSILQYKCVEEYLATKYNLCLPVPPIDILPTPSPTKSPTPLPTKQPSFYPTIKPSLSPTEYPTQQPSEPTIEPTSPTTNPSSSPTIEPTIEPSNAPTTATINPSQMPSISPTITTINPTSAPVSPTFATNNPTTFTPTTHPSISPTASTNSPSNVPTASPVTGSCEDNGLIKPLYWNNISNSLPEIYDFSIDIDISIDLGINIELITDYLGHSYDTNNNQIGTSYILDFAQFHSYSDKIEKPGTCSNRLSSSYNGKAFAEYWGYSPNPSDANQLENINYLAYGPLPSPWILTAETECTKIRYSGDFTWNNLRYCRDYEGNNLVSIDTDDDWVNMSGRFYLSVISPITMSADIGYYIKDLIVSYPFKISIEKSIHILNSIGINVFLVTIFQSRRTYANLHDNDDGGYIIVLSTQTADYLQLKDSNLLTSPEQYNSWTITPFIYDNGNILNGTCYITANDICIQFWKIEIHNLNCPISFNGIFDIEWTAACNSDNIDNSECNSYLDNYGSTIALSINMDYTDPFECDAIDHQQFKYSGVMNFYDDFLFITIDNNKVYRSGIDTVYVEVQINDLPSILSVNLLNVWICSTNINSDILQILSGNEMSSGCFDYTKINTNTFNAIILNSAELLYNAHIYDTSSIANNITRFSFTTPDFVGVNTIYIHSEIELTYNNGSVVRRMLLSTTTSDSVYDFVHLGGDIQVDSSDKPEDVPETRTKPPYWIYVIVIVIASLLSIFIIIFVILLLLYIKSKKENNNVQEMQQQHNNNNNIQQKEMEEEEKVEQENVDADELVGDVIEGVNETMHHTGDITTTVDGECETGINLVVDENQDNQAEDGGTSALDTTAAAIEMIFCDDDPDFVE